MAHVSMGDSVSLRIASRFLSVYSRLGAVDSTAVPLPSGILPDQDFKGMGLPVFYTSRIALDQPEYALRAGMSGKAKIFGGRRSVASRIVTFLMNVFRTHFW
jgi:hypothetical protein